MLPGVLATFRRQVRCSREKAAFWNSLPALTLDVFVLIPWSVSCPQHADALECTAPVCCSSDSLVYWLFLRPPIGPETVEAEDRQRTTQVLSRSSCYVCFLLSLNQSGLLFKDLAAQCNKPPTTLYPKFQLD